MDGDWLAASSLERADALLLAVNTLSIHAKLQMAHQHESSPIEADAVASARTRLLSFLDELVPIVAQGEKGISGTVVGTDPRMGEFAQRYLSNRKRWPRKSPLYAFAIPKVRELIATEDPERLTEQIACLADLRTLIEQHAQIDIVGILGNL